MDSVLDTVGRQLDINVDFGQKRIFVIRAGPSVTRSVIAVLDVKQALKLSAIVTHAARYIIDPEVDAP